MFYNYQSLYVLQLSITLCFTIIVYFIFNMLRCRSSDLREYYLFILTVCNSLYFSVIKLPYLYFIFLWLWQWVWNNHSLTYYKKYPLSVIGCCCYYTSVSNNEGDVEPPAPKIRKTASSVVMVDQPGGGGSNEESNRVLLDSVPDNTLNMDEVRGSTLLFV